ncbi:hypothetical protein [Nonomuraea endophytica]|uniref:hypothetical protein n=1 Tax=Nonomuraea endophytica TaxID=714136 RepID=UPI0037CB9DCA
MRSIRREKEDVMRRITVTCAMLAVLGGGLPLATATPAAAAACTGKTLHYYPGSGFAPRPRYGEVEVKMKICGSNQNNWTVSDVNYWRNSTGKALGFEFDSVRVPEESSGTRTYSGVKRRYKEWTLKITASTCPGKICTRSYGFTARIEVYMEGNGRYRWNRWNKTTSSAPGVVLYTTS